MLKKWLLIVGLLMSGLSYAETPVWHVSTIKNVYPLNNGNFIIVFDEDSPDCTHASNYFNVTVGQSGVTQEGLQNMLTTALAAGMSKKTVQVNFDKDSASCFINRIMIHF